MPLQRTILNWLSSHLTFIAGMFGYKEITNYKTDEGAKDVKVDFSK